MPRQRSPERDRAYELWKASAGERSLTDIASEIGIADARIRKWKSEDKWDERLAKEPKPKEPRKRIERDRKRIEPDRKPEIEITVNGRTLKPVRINDEKDEPFSFLDEDDMDNLGLNERQRLFVKHYLTASSAAEAAKLAGYKDSESVYATASQLLKLPKIRAAIRMERMRLETETDVTNAMIIGQLARIAFSDINDYIDYEDRPPVRVVDPESGEVTWESIRSVVIKPGAMVDGSVISEIRQTRDGIAFKRYDALDALKTLAKIKGLLDDNVNVNHSGAVTTKNEQHYHIIQRTIRENPELVPLIFGRGIGTLPESPK